MSRKANAALRCNTCRLHLSLCICSLIPDLRIETRVVLVIHRREEKKPTNTGMLAIRCLGNSEVVVRGHEGEPSQARLWPLGTEPLLLFPHEGATPLADFPRPTLPVTLIVPDGTWSQASKVRHRVAGLADVPCVTLPVAEPSLYRIRSEPHAYGLATIEAIARALEFFEGPAVRSALEQVFRAMVERTLWARGGIARDAMTTGVPAGAMRHDPSKGSARERFE